MSRRPTVAVIGAGFSGLLTALRLVAAPGGPTVRLVERRARFAQGAAYATANPDHLLNVRAANMSAFAEGPTHFLDWLRSRGSPSEPHTFVTRGAYGEYLQHLLRQAVMTPNFAGRLALDGDEVVGLTSEGAGWRLALGVGRSLEADAVVLALGNLPPHPPCPVDDAVLATGRYVANPWAWEAEAAPAEGLAVLLGSGLTMVDVALDLSARRPGLKMLALSRRGLSPRRHVEAGPAPGWDAKPEGSVASLLHLLRGRAEAVGWREAVDGLRPHVQAIWRDWPLKERRRFLRHARPWWDVHRHRLAPSVAERLDHLTASGALRIAAGQVLEFATAGPALEMLWRPRHRRELVRTPADLVINCTGPSGDLEVAGESLIGNLARQGLIRPDACTLGLDVDSQSRLIARDGRPNETLFAVGPITRGAFWEITSVPDIRIQAAGCAEGVLQALRSRHVQGAETSLIV